MRIRVPLKHFHVFCGLGAGARGFNMGEARVGNLEAEFVCVGGVDVDASAIRDFKRLTGCDGTVLDLFSREQYVAFHGREPPPGWREATPDDIRKAAHGQFPDIIFLSAPCKGFSGLLAEAQSLTDKYQALNQLTLRGMMLVMEAFKDHPPKLVIFENVPRIATRGRALVDAILSLMRVYGYIGAETKHDCGKLGHLAQSRERFLAVFRHAAQVPNFLYTPPQHRLRGVGEVLDRMALPGDIDAAGPMHRVPSLQWKTWVRLAFVEAGKDWRSLNNLAVEDGVLKDFALMPDRTWRDGALGVLAHDSPAGVVTAQAEATTGRFSVADPSTVNALEGSGHLGVRRWEDPAQLVTGDARPTKGPHSVADPRFDAKAYEAGQYGVRSWNEASGAIINVKSPGQGGYAVADPRVDGRTPFNHIYRIVGRDETSPAVHGGGGYVADPRGDANRHVNGKYRVTPYGGAANAVIGGSTTGNGAFAVADPRPTHGPNAHTNKHKVVAYEGSAPTVTGSDRVGSGALSVADPRPASLNREDREGYSTQGHYGVVDWQEPSRAVPAFAKNNNGMWSVADPRPDAFLPAADEKLTCIIIARDGTWHRPFTTLELAALQSIYDPDDFAEIEAEAAWRSKDDPDWKRAHFMLEGSSDSAWRERIGNAVPPAAAKAIAGVMGQTLLLAMHGETFSLSNEEIWVRQMEIALSVMPAELPA